MNQKKFSVKSFRRITEKPDMANMRDYMEFTLTMNKENSDAKKRFLNSSPKKQDLAKSFAYSNNAQARNYFDPSGTSLSPAAHKRDLSQSHLNHYANDVQLRPKLLESKLTDKAEF